VNQKLTQFICGRSLSWQDPNNEVKSPDNEVQNFAFFIEVSPKTRNPPQKIKIGVKANVQNQRLVNCLLTYWTKKS